MGLDVTMAYPLRVDVCQRPEQLIDIQFDFQDGHHGLQLIEISRCTVDCFWYVFEDQVQVDFVSLCSVSNAKCKIISGYTHSLSVTVVESLEFNDIWMLDNSHDLQLSILVIQHKQGQKFNLWFRITLNRLSCSTRLMAASSPLGDSLV